MKTNKIRIFTDGACSGNPGPGGWGAIILSPTGRVKELGGAAPQTTNNRMELTATIEALLCLQRAKQLSTHAIILFTDSTYVIRGITEWIFNWERNNWKNSSGDEISNRELWEALLAVIREGKLQVEWQHVRGHHGIPGNERCDEIAVAFSKHSEVSLYDGLESGYRIDLHEVPSPEQPKGKKRAPLYLSYLSGKLHRDPDWKTCEARIKGIPNAKYKKVLSQEEETECLKKWGIKS